MDNIVQSQIVRLPTFDRSMVNHLSKFTLGAVYYGQHNCNLDCYSCYLVTTFVTRKCNLSAVNLS